MYRREAFSTSGSADPRSKVFLGLFFQMSSRAKASEVQKNWSNLHKTY